MNSLTEIRDTLRAALSSERLLKLVTTRVTLRTGVDLSALAERGNARPGDVEKVLAALTELGFTASSLKHVAQKKGLP